MTYTARTEKERKDVYTRVTERIISDLEQGVRSWMKPWHVKHTAGKINHPASP
jgi:antirestriction protein ArdC